MGFLSRKTLSSGFRLFDLLLMAVSFVLAARPIFHKIGIISPSQFFSMRVRLGVMLLFLIFPLIWHVLFNACGLYASRRLSTRTAEVFDILKATTLGTLVLAAAGASGHVWMINREFLFLFWAFSSVLALSSRMFIRSLLAYLRRHGRNSRNVIIVGTNPRAVNFVHHLERHSELGYRLLGFADEAWPGLTEFDKSPYPLVCDLDGLAKYLRLNVVDEVVVGLPIRSFHSLASQIAWNCEQQGIILRYLPNLFDLKEATQRSHEVEGYSLVSHESTVTDGWALMVKRVIDVVLSSSAILVLSPVLILTAIIIKLTAPGPVFFVQKRLGLNKRMFHIYKFRTMVVDAEKRLKDLEHLNEVSGPVFKITKDPRITAVGAFLRKTSIDELPQLINVLKGDMSLVGPRPLQVRDYELFNSLGQDWQRRRFSVRPGITCLWQVMGRSSIPFEKWMELDLQYVRNWSLWLDFEILLKTVPAVLKGSGAA